MPNKRNTNKDLNEAGWKTCSFCGDSVKIENFERHLEKVHLEVDEDDDDDYEVRKVKRSKSGKNKKKKAEMRKDQEHERRRKQDLSLFIGMIVVIGIIIGAYFLSTNPGPDDDKINTLKVGETRVVPGTNEVQIPVSDVDDGKAHFYYFDSNGVRVNYFVLKSSDGVIRAAFDTCDVCYEAKKGYHQEGDYMVCNNCGQRFSSVNINEIKGGCNPAPLDRTVSGGNVVITSDTIAAGRWYFD